jgi:glycerophosphoryl diester phosphodiesterase
MQTIKEYVQSVDLVIAAHRGSSGTAPENTMAAFREAIDTGLRFIECDVRFTEDSEIVALHDFENEEFSEKPILYSKIKDMDVGSWFSPDFANEKPPKLEEILEFIVQSNSFLNIELKEFKKEDSSKKINLLIEKICKANAQKRVMICSFNYKLLKEIKSVCPRIPTATIMLPGSQLLPAQTIEITAADGFVCSLDELNDEIVKNAKENNIYVGVYSVDSEKDFEKLFQYDIKAFGTNYPKKIVNILKEKYPEIRY